MQKKFLGLNLLLMSLTVGVAQAGDSFDQAYNKFNTKALIDDVKILSSDAYEGRSPTGIGAEKTQSFLQKRFMELGVQPGNGDNYFQDVPLVEITADPSMQLNIGENTFKYGTDYVAVSKHVTNSVSLKDSELVFIGYGVKAPEYDWDDYDIDVKGKTVVVLVNDPGFTTGDPKLFNGKAMTYYGRWTYKYEEASRQGAAAIFIVHETLPASYPWGVVENGTKPVSQSHQSLQESHRG